MSKRISKKENFYIFVALFLGALFAFITIKTPLAGDDWGYALNGMKGNPIEMAISFYNSWSGRFFSELWGFVVAPRKWLWNILNPLLFVGIFLATYKLVRTKNKFVVGPLFIIACMLSVDDQLRMETYSWIMGTTYVIPLFMALWYFVSIDYLFKVNLFEKKTKVIAIANNALLIIVGLMMENIAGAMIGAIVLLIIYAFYNRKKILSYLIINLAISSAAFALMRLSPGSTYRLMRDSADWAALPLFDKLIGAYPTFISNTFINNNYLILFFSIVIVLMILGSKKENVLLKLACIAIMALGVVSAFSFVIPQLAFMQQGDSLYSMLFWPIYTFVAIFSMFIFQESGYQRDKSIFFVVIGGACSLAMLFSPINGARSSIYVVYFLILAATTVLDKTQIQKYIKVLLIVVICFVIVDRTKEFVQKYTYVGLAQQERLEIIEYYKNNPQDKEVWIPRFPIFTVHGADIEPTDSYHLETFKEYYKLPQDANMIIFYFKSGNE